MNIINAILRKTTGLYTVTCDGDRISAITEQSGHIAAAPGDIDANGQKLCSPVGILLRGGFAHTEDASGFV